MVARSTSAQLRAWMIEHAPGYTLVGDTYATRNSPITVRHDGCGHEWETRARYLKEGRRCPMCHRFRLWTAAEFQAEVDAKFGAGRYVLEGPYLGAGENVRLRHVQCGKVWTPKPRDALTGRRENGCAHCNAAPTEADRHGAGVIGTILRGLGLEYVRNATFDDCRTAGARKRLSAFDFYVPSLELAVEYEWPNPFLDRPETARPLLAARAARELYCRSSGIHLVRLSHSRQTTLLDELLSAVEEARRTLRQRQQS